MGNVAAAVAGAGAAGDDDAAAALPSRADKLSKCAPCVPKKLPSQTNEDGAKERTKSHESNEAQRDIEVCAKRETCPGTPTQTHRHTHRE